MVEIVLFAIVVFCLAHLNNRNNDLERRMSGLERRLLERDDATADLAEPAIQSRDTKPPPARDDEAPTPAEPPLIPVRPPPVPASPAEARPARGLEELIGSQWAVWVGGLALALGGIFLVRYSIEHSLVGPRLRVAMGLVLAVALLGAGEWLRRQGRDFGKANIPATLAAAGVSTAFAAVYAAYALYGLVGPTLGFLALAALSFVAMAAAILHGPALGGLGLLAALASPMMIDAQDASPISLVLYLTFAVGAAYGVARIRLWRWLAIAAAAGGLLWGFGLFVIEVTGLPPIKTAYVLTLIQLALALLFLVVDPYRRITADEMRVDRMVTIVLFWFAVLAIAVGLTFEAGLGKPVFIALVVAMLTAAALRYPAAAGGLLWAGFAAVGTLAVWPVLGEAALEPERFARDLARAPYPDAVRAFIGTAVSLPALVAFAGLVRLGFGWNLRFGPAAWYAASLTLAPIAALVAAYWRIASFDHSIPFALAAGLLALGFTGAAAWLRGRDPTLENPIQRLGVGASVAAAIAVLAVGFTFVLDRGVLTIALALSALGTAFVADRLRVPVLRWMVGALGIAIAARLAYDPSVMRGEIGATPIFNWLLLGYGVPAVSLLLASRVLTRDGRDNVSRLVEGLGYIFAALLVFMQIRHALNAGDPFAPRSSHLEAGLIATLVFGFALLMVRLDLTRSDPMYRIASLVLGVVGLVGTAVELGLHHNPYLSGERIIGGAIFNSLLGAYLLPAAMAGILAQVARANRPRIYVLGAFGLAVALLLAYCAMAIRRAFHPDGFISFFHTTSQEELWSYSFALLILGLGLFGVGIARNLPVVRLTGLGCLVGAVLKVFLIDLSVLEGLTRAFSFVGLGVALLLLGFVYQRFALKQDEPPAGG